MKTITSPRIEAVEPMSGKKLLVWFVGGQQTVYDCRLLLKQEPFSALEDDSFFRQVKVDPGGYGISWSDQIDLSESELWLKGKSPVNHPCQRTN
jgi:hypothetical protein